MKIENRQRVPVPRDEWEAIFVNAQRAHLAADLRPEEIVEFHDAGGEPVRRCLRVVTHVTSGGIASFRPLTMDERGAL